ncbi:sterol desaturase family protein [Bacillus salitolerans]|uniref:Sterol desaturase family protein n=1 Tax=Bacillus salitolerans TaxID=1437434 RepID=A0ABW4LXW8_9BACI
MRKHVVTFIQIHDVWMMLVLVLLSFMVIFTHLASGILWIYILLGILLYIVSEYTTHRFFFHMKAPKNKLFLKFMKRIHYDHHDDPDDVKLLFLPIWYSLPQLGILVGIVTLLTDHISYGLAVFIGSATTLLYYEWSHFVAHHPIQPKTVFGKWMKKLHLLHHYKNENYWYGVTNPSMDYLFGTMKDGKEVSKSDTARKLEMKG